MTEVPLERLHKMTPEEAVARNLPACAATYRGMVGGHYDVGAALQFGILTLMLGLRERHYLLDIGCGSLRSGRLFIPYLARGHYFCIEPEMWMVDEAFDKELGWDIEEVKDPSFSDNEDFLLTVFGLKFDFLLAASIFTHAGPEMIRTCLAQAKKVMKSDATFVATYYKGDTEWHQEGWHPAPRFYKMETMRGFVEEAEFIFTPIDITRYNPPEWPKDVSQEWFLITNEPI